MKSKIIGVTIDDELKEVLIHRIESECENLPTICNHYVKTDGEKEPVVIVNMVQKPNGLCDVMYRRYRIIEWKGDVMTFLDDAANIVAYEYKLREVRN